MINKNELVSYFNSKLSLSILVPRNWNFSIINDSSIRLFGEFERGYKDFFEEYRPSISFEIIKQKKIIDFDQLFEELSSKQNFDNNQYKIISEKKSYILNKYYYEKKYSWREENSNIEIYQIQGFIQSSLNSYILINAAVFEKYKVKYYPLFDLILGSIRII